MRLPAPVAEVVAEEEQSPRAEARQARLRPVPMPAPEPVLSLPEGPAARIAWSRQLSRRLGNPASGPPEARVQVALARRIAAHFRTAPLLRVSAPSLSHPAPPVAAPAAVRAEASASWPLSRIFRAS